jgi:hypothetical protein
MRVSWGCSSVHLLTGLCIILSHNLCVLGNHTYLASSSLPPLMNLLLHPSNISVAGRQIYNTVVGCPAAGRIFFFSRWQLWLFLTFPYIEFQLSYSSSLNRIMSFCSTSVDAFITIARQCLIFVQFSVDKRCAGLDFPICHVFQWWLQSFLWTIQKTNEARPHHLGNASTSCTRRN